MAYAGQTKWSQWPLTFAAINLSWEQSHKRQMNCNKKELESLEDYLKDLLNQLMQEKDLS